MHNFMCDLVAMKHFMHCCCSLLCIDMVSEYAPGHLVGFVGVQGCSHANVEAQLSIDGCDGIRHLVLDLQDKQQQDSNSVTAKTVSETFPRVPS
jgi:hypothetical protein